MESEGPAIDAHHPPPVTDDEVGVGVEVEVVMFGRQFPYRFVVAAVFVSALFLDILDSTIVNVAIPSIGRDLRTEAVEWVVIGYTLSLAVFIPASGWLGDRFGTKRVFMAALVIFIGCSALCGAARNLEQLVVFRILQGAGGGMLTPVGIAMMFRAFPPAQRARAATIVMIPTLLAPALGPVLGGLLTDSVGWRWIFYVNVPVGFAVIAFGARYLREHTEPTAGGFDAAGFVLSGAGLAAIVYALSEGPGAGWTNVRVWGLGLLGALAFVLLVRVETRRPAPMLALRLLRERLFRASNIVMGLGMAGFAGLIFVLPLYLQNLRGLDAFESGLTTFPQALGVLVSSQIAGRIYGRVGPRRLMAFGMALAATVMAAFVFIGPDTDLWLLRILLFGRGFALGFPFVASQAASYARVLPVDNGRASAIFATQRQMAVSIGIALLATVLSMFMPLVGPPPDVDRAMHGYRIAFVVAAALPALAAFAAWRLVRDIDAAETMVRRRRRRPAAPESAPA